MPGTPVDRGTGRNVQHPGEDGTASRLLSSDLLNHVQFLTARARAVGTSLANTGLAPFDLTVRSFSLLALADSGLKPSQRELADFLRLDPSQIVTLVDQLERRGLVTREADPRDRRSKTITTTTAGHGVQKRAYAAIQAAEEESLRDLSLEERRQLLGLLRRIAF